MRKLILRSGIVSLLALLLVPVFAAGQTKPLDPANLDKEVKPSQDFFEYANGGWLKQNPIPADQALWGSFNELQEHNYVVLHDILDEAARHDDEPAGTPWQLVGDFYGAGMDSAAVEAAGITPLKSEFEAIDAIKDAKDLQHEIVHLQTYAIGVPWSFRAAQDDKRSTDVIAHLGQAGLSLPDRDYYTKQDPQSVKLREQFTEHVKAMFVLLGDAPEKAATEAATVLNLETALAKASLTRVERRDPNATYHKMGVGDLKAIAPTVAWDAYFAGLGLKDPGQFNVAVPKFMKCADSMVAATPIADWKVYLRWHLINSTDEYLSSPFVTESFKFGGMVLTGAKEMRPRWKRVLESTNRAVGFALGQLYVSKAFSPAAKERAAAMVANLKAALHDRIAKLPWMSEATKAAAFKKLDAFGVKIGYPDKWRDYSLLKVNRASYVGNALAARQFEFNRNLKKIGQPLDRTEWGMVPPTVNAYYSSNMNEIVFPAGILQPPFFDPNADDAVNYGGMGAVIGHEMTHGFDDQGRQYDAEGNLKDWWTADDAKNFLARAKMVEDQFSGYLAIDTLHVNGKTTLGENIADLGGLKIAFDAFEKSLEGKPRPGLIDGFTPEQRFFLAWAQIWRTNIRPEALRLRIATDPHSPGKFRTIGPLSNLDEFLKAFDVKEGDAMARPAAERVNIW